MLIRPFVYSLHEKHFKAIKVTTEARTGERDVSLGSDARKLAERGGFEPPVRFNPYNGLANRHFRPLSHLSSRCMSVAAFFDLRNQIRHQMRRKCQAGGVRQNSSLERFKKFCGRLRRGFLSSGEALATEHVRSDLRRSRNEARTQKDRPFSNSANGHRIFKNALITI